MCFVWIWEQTAIISLYSINWLVFIRDGVCLLRGTDWIFIYNSGESEPLKRQRLQLYTHLVWRHRQHKRAHSCYYTSPRTDCQSSRKVTNAIQATVTVLSKKVLYSEVSKYLITGFSGWKNVVKTYIYIYIYIYISPYLKFSDVT